MPEVEIDEFGLKYSTVMSDSLIDGLEIKIANLRQCDELVTKNWPIETFIGLLWHELYSEYDAQNLSRYLHAARIPLSSEFIAFERWWLRDENSHCLAFRRLVTQLCNCDPCKIDERLSRRVGNFSSIARWLQDEFQACVLLAYDESVTAQAYRMDFPIYRNIGIERLNRWIHHIVLDEVRHFNNLITIIRNSHSHRVAEIPSLLNEILEFDRGSEDYLGTFVLDHTGFSLQILETARKAVIRKSSFP